MILNKEPKTPREMLEYRINMLKQVYRGEELEFFMETLGITKLQNELEAFEQRTADMSVGDRVQVIIPANPNEQMDEPRYLPFVGEEAIIVQTHPSPSYHYSLFFINPDVQKKYKTDMHGVYFSPFYVSKLESNDSMYQLYLDEEANRKKREKYRYGTCSKCQGPLNMHYVLWCPSCEKPEGEYGKRKAFDLLKVLYHVQAQVQDDEFKQRVWSFLCDKTNLSNDKYLHVKFELATDNEQIKNDFEAIKQYMNIEKDSMWFYVTW